MPLMKKNYKVPLVDDNVEDQLLTQFALKDSSHFEIVACVNNGELAVAYFKGWHQYAKRSEFPLPDLVLLDLNMPLRDGFEVLRWLNSHPQPGLVKVMLTSSESETDIARATALGAHGYIVKPGTFRDMQSLESRLLICMNAVRGPAVQGQTHRRNSGPRGIRGIRIPQA